MRQIRVGRRRRARAGLPVGDAGGRVRLVRSQPSIRPAPRSWRSGNAVADYVKVHKEADGQVPSLTETSGSREDLRTVKWPSVRHSRVCAPAPSPATSSVAEVSPVLIKAIRDDFAERSATDRKAIVDELPPSMTLTVNMIYPSKLPLATFPAKLLRVLPDLPPELEYRIVGRHSDPARRQGQHHRRLRARRGADHSELRCAMVIAVANIARRGRTITFCCWRAARGLCAGSPCPDAAGRSTRRSASAGHGRPTTRARRRRRVGKDSLRFAVIGDSGTRRPRPVRGRRPADGVAGGVPVRVRADARRQHLRRRAAAGLRRQVREAVQGDPGAEDPLLRVARQPRRSEPAFLRAVQHERASGSTRSRRRRAVLRARQQLHGQGPAGLARNGAVRVDGHAGRSRSSTTRSIRPANGTAPRWTFARIVEPLFIKHGVERGVRRPRALLRAAEAAEGHPLLHQRRAPPSCGPATSGSGRSPPRASTPTTRTC